MTLLWHCLLFDTPFTRYNRLSHRLSNRFDNTTGLTTGLTTGCIHDTAGCQTGCQTGLTTGCIVYTNIYPLTTGLTNRLYRVNGALKAKFHYASCFDAGSKLVRAEIWPII